jgi:haloacetate dehalogenase
MTSPESHTTLDRHGSGAPATEPCPGDAPFRETLDERPFPAEGMDAPGHFGEDMDPDRSPVPSPSGETDRRSFLGASLALLLGSAVSPTAAGALAATGAAWPEDGPRRTRPAGDPARDRALTQQLFPGFERIRIETSEATIAGVKGGSGPPLLLLHGYPQSHLEWHHVAPRLAQRFTVIATDLRGYGASSVPPDGEENAGYSKRAMARDQVEMMESLGFDRFALVGHDRGGRVAHRLTLDHPERVERLAVLDIVPTLYLYRNVTREFATSYYHWFFMIQRAPLPERLYGSNADFVLRSTLFGGLVGGAIPEAVYAEYLRAYSEPERLHAMCEDYRAGAGIDLVHDEADLDRRIECPLLALWGASGTMARLYDVLGIWSERGTDVRGGAIPGGHWFPESSPDETFAALSEFLAS